MKHCMQRAQNMVGLPCKEILKTFNLLLTKLRLHINAIKDLLQCLDQHGAKESQQFSLLVLRH